MKKQAGPIDAIVDKINDLGQQVHNLGKKVPGLDWAAKLGEMSLSSNKYLRAAQIIGTALGGIAAPVGVLVLIKKVLSGGDSGEEALGKLMNLTAGLEKKIQLANQMGATVQQHMQTAASFPEVKNPILRARLLRCAARIQMLEEYRKLAGDDLMLIPLSGEEDEEDEDEDVEGGMLGDLGEAIGNQIAPRTTQNIKDMAASSDCEGEDTEACGMDDGSYPAGPRNEPNQSRYKVEPGHGQSSVDLLRFTAAIDRAIVRLEKAANG